MQKRGYHDFSFKIFCLTVPKNFVGTLRCIRKLRVAKNFMHQRGGVSRFSVESFCHTVPKNFVGIVRCFRKFCLSQNFMHKKGISLNSVEKLLSHSADKIRRKLLFRKNSGIENFQAKEGGSFTVLSNFFLSHRTEKTSPGNHSMFQKISGREKYFMNKRGGYHEFPSKFLSHCTEIFHWRTLWCFRKILLSKIFKHRRGRGIPPGFVELFCLTGQKRKPFCKGEEPFCFPEIFWYRKKFMEKRGLITFFRRNFLVSQCRKISWASLQCFRKFGVSKNFMHNRGYHNFPSKIFSLTGPKNFV